MSVCVLRKMLFPQINVHVLICQEVESTQYDMFSSPRCSQETES